MHVATQIRAGVECAPRWMRCEVRVSGSAFAVEVDANDEMLGTRLAHDLSVGASPRIELHDLPQSLLRILLHDLGSPVLPATAGIHADSWLRLDVADIFTPAGK